MLITDKNAAPIRPLRVVRNGILFCTLSAICYFFLYPAYVLRKESPKDPNVVICDMERSFRGEFITEGNRFSGGDLRRDKYSNSGKYSCFLLASEGSLYTLGYDIKNVKPGDIFQFSLWYFQEEEAPVFMVASNEAEQYYAATEKVVDSNKRQWKKLSMRRTIPANFNGDKLRFYVYTSNGKDTYIDDVKIERIVGAGDENAYLPKKIQLQLSEKQMKKLRNNRIRALDKQLIFTDENSWCKATLIDEGKEKAASIRLKGDWLDHLQGKKWSFRVKLKDPYTFNRMITFSVHTPSARFYTMEWLIHKMWKNEDVLTTRYDFVNLSLNNEELGVYAYEEHFEKQLVESRSRREGPILKFSEEALWKIRRHQMRTEWKLNNETVASGARMENATVEAFKESKIAKSPTLSKQFEIGKNLLVQFQNGTKQASEIFDVELMANFLAISDFMSAYHCLIWHNMRFYYNPISTKLEPIGYDGFAGGPPYIPKLFARQTLDVEGDVDMKALLRIFEDEVMLKAYMKAMYKLTDETYIDSLTTRLEKDYTNRTSYLKKEFPNYDFEIRKELKRRAKILRDRITPLKDYAIRAQWLTTGEVNQLEVKNLSKIPIVVEGFGTQKNAVTALSPVQNIIHPTKSAILTPPIGAKYLGYKLAGVDSIYFQEIPGANKGNSISPFQKLSRTKVLPVSNLYTSTNNKVTFKRGKQIVTKDIFIPANYEVIFEAGCHLSFQGSTKFLSRSPIQMIGTEKDRIIIESMDGKAMGFTVLKAGGKSKISHTDFSNFNTLSYQGWNLTGAVTFYESDVDISFASFNGANCEDALNIVYSNFNLENILLDGAASDGFDADFCKGNIINSIFKNTTNDGVDVSGSQVLLEQVQFQNCGDKAISVGEESEAYIKEVSIDKAVIGVASKDLSEVTIESISLKNCNQGFAAYQKKPEFGSSLILVEDYEANEVKYLYKLGFGSKLQLGSRLIVGK